MQFIKCKECDTIIAIKDLQEPFTPEILDQATDENTIHGEDLCAACAQRHEEERKAAEEAARQQEQEEAVAPGTETSEEE